MFSRASTSVIAALASLGAAGLTIPPALAETVAPVESAIMVQPVAPIRTVLAADNRTHLIYELLVINQSALIVTLDAIAVLDGVGGAVLKELSGGDLAGAARVSIFGAAGTTLQPAQSAFVFVDASMPQGVPAPVSVRHRISTHQAAAAGSGTADLGGLSIAPQGEVPPTVTFLTAAIAVDRSPAMVLQPPVRGDGWIIFRGCCDLATSHRGSTTSFNGTMYVAERFAIDFVRIGEDGLLIAGPGNVLASYRYYGLPVYAVADGTVISARNDAPNQVPGALPEGMTADAAGGNAVLLDIGGGRFVFYAHMNPGTVRVKAGDRVRAGDVIGAIGNSGKSVGPHLHFHVMDAASPGAADGLPYVFAAFTSRGVLGDNALGLAFQGQAPPIDAAKLAGPHQNQHPLNNQVVDFGK
jgi:murein DD-endopeptidase MepM/ murein hydrolase activator NlpD